jgi:putative two-component system hydrogenase maturation factor HypX/HoxX
LRPEVGAPRLALDAGLPDRLEEKRRRRARDERINPLRAYRTAEMARAYRCFFGADRSYHEARRRFTHKLGATPPSTGSTATVPSIDAVALRAG